MKFDSMKKTDNMVSVTDMARAISAVTPTPGRVKRK